MKFHLLNDSSQNHENINEILWVCEQFLAMGASPSQIEDEFNKMCSDHGYLYHCLDLLDFNLSYLKNRVS